MDPSYTIRNIDSLDTPALVYYEEKIRHNISQMGKLLGGFDRLRPHIKTHKCREVLRLQMAAGIRRFKCATPKEVELAASEGAPEILLAYQVVGPLARRAAGLQKKFASLSLEVLVDAPEQVTDLSQACRSSGVELGAIVDVNPGLNRTGVPPRETATLVRGIVKAPGLRFAGLHSYGSRPAQGTAEERKAIYRASTQTVVDARRALERDGISVPKLIAGGSLDCFADAEMAGVDEVSPGTFVLWDRGYEDLLPGHFGWGALVIGRVISRPTPRTFTVDAGYKSVSADPALPHCEILSVPGSTVIGRWEEHLLAELPAPSVEPAVGTPVYIVPVHVCSTVNLWDEALVVDGRGEVAGRWRIEARGH
jgi:D-threonine aldolase